MQLVPQEMSQNPYYISGDYETKQEYPKTPNNRNSKSDTTEQVWHRFNQNTGDQTPCEPFVKAYESTMEPGKVLCVQLRCRSWKCKTCGPLLRFNWYQKQIGSLLNTGTLYQKVIDGREWTAVRKALNRQSEQYMTYDREDGRVLVITTGQIGGIRLNSSHEALREVLVRAIETTPLQRQPISQSRNWVKSKVDAPKVEETKKWKALDSCSVRTLEEVKEILTSEGYNSYNYELETDMYSTEKGLIFTLKPADYFRVLWKLGVNCRNHNEKRTRGGPPQEIAA